jgi:3-ketosteroid 9alpha-monooxygenase subunit A
MVQPALTTFPKGWFVVAFSDEIAKGQAVRLKYFGEEMVAFRGEDGNVHVLDGYCAHMGAHLGAGGKVVDNCVVCPFHSWKYAGTGECVAIPYAKKIPTKARQKAWLTREVNGVVLLHHDSTGAPPEWDIPVIPEHGAPDWLPWARNMYHVKTHPREIIENIADKGHFPTVHKTEIVDFELKVEGHKATQITTGRALLPGGGVDNFTSSSTYHGPGYLLMRMAGALDNYMLVAHTPVDQGSVDLRMGVMLKIVGNRSKTEGFVAHYMANIKSGFEDDMKIWENKLYREHPVFCDGDGPIGQARRWYRQFYVPTGSAASAVSEEASAQ